MKPSDDVSCTVTDAGSSGCGAQSLKQAPESPHSHSSSALCTEEISHPRLPVLCFQPKPAKHSLAERHAKPSSSGFAPIRTSQHIQQAGLPVHRRSRMTPSGRRLSDALCEAGLFEGPHRSFSDPLTAPVSFHGKGKCAGSDSDNAEEQVTTWRLHPLDDAGHKSSFRGVSFDKKKRKWRVQIKVANLGKCGVSVGYFDTERDAATAYDRAAISLLGKDDERVSTNFPLKIYQEDEMPELIGKSREEVKTSLKHDRARLPRKKYSSRQRTSRFMGVGSSNRKNQWQARILVHGKVTHLGYYETEEGAARIYDRVAISLNGPGAQTNFPISQYAGTGHAEFKGLAREDLQRALGVKPMDKSSQFRGVSRKKGKWEAKVMVNRKWAYRALFDSEAEAARAYDAAVWRLKPKEAVSFVNFKDGIAARLGKRSSRAASSLPRTKSQKLDCGSIRGLPPMLPGTPFGLTAADLDDLEEPTTPTRRHSIQLPVSRPLDGEVLVRHCSAAISPHLPAAVGPNNGEKVAQLHQDDLLQLPHPASQALLGPDVSPQQSSFSRRPSLNQLQPTLSSIQFMTLPDPNSIGVPPPSQNLPYPELIGLPVAPEVVEHSSSVGMPAGGPPSGLLPVSSGLPARGLSGSGLPEIPLPLLPAEASRLGMGGYVTSTPLSNGLSQGLSSAAPPILDFATDPHSQQQPPQHQPNPFQEASVLLPPISSCATPKASSLLVRVGSESHLLQDRQTGLQRINSLTASMDVFPHESSLPIPRRLSSVGSGALPRAASESLLRGLQHVDAHNGQTVQLEGFGAMQFSTALVQQPSLASSLTAHNGLLGQVSLSSQPSLPSGVGGYGGAPPSQLQRSVFHDYGAPDFPGQFEPVARTLSHMDSSTSFGGLRSCRTANSEFISSILSGGEEQAIHRSMSTSSLLQPQLPPYGRRDCGALPHSASSAQIFPGLQHTTSLDSHPQALSQLGLPPLPIRTMRDSPPISRIAIPAADAAGILADLGMDEMEVDMPECHLLDGVQIGGEDLYSPKPAVAPF